MDIHLFWIVQPPYIERMTVLIVRMNTIHWLGLLLCAVSMKFFLYQLISIIDNNSMIPFSKGKMLNLLEWELLLLYCCCIVITVVVDGLLYCCILMDCWWMMIASSMIENEKVRTRYFIFCSQMSRSCYRLTVTRKAWFRYVFLPVTSYLLYSLVFRNARSKGPRVSVRSKQACPFRLREIYVTSPYLSDDSWNKNIPFLWSRNCYR